MKIFLQKVEYSLLALFLAVQTQVPFVLIQFYKGRDQSFSMGIHLAYPDDLFCDHFLCPANG